MCNKVKHSEMCNECKIKVLEGEIQFNYKEMTKLQIEINAHIMSNEHCEQEIKELKEQ